MDGMTERAMLEPDTLARSRIVRRHMQSLLEACDTLDAASLARRTAADFDLYDDAAGTKIIQVVFEVAAQVITARQLTVSHETVSQQGS